jgi:hypothetical protein
MAGTVGWLVRDAKREPWKRHALSPFCDRARAPDHTAPGHTGDARELYNTRGRQCRGLGMAQSGDRCQSSGQRMRRASLAKRVCQLGRRHTLRTARASLRPHRRRPGYRNRARAVPQPTTGRGGDRLCRPGRLVPGVPGGALSLDFVAGAGIGIAAEGAILLALGRCSAARAGQRTATMLPRRSGPGGRTRARLRVITARRVTALLPPIVRSRGITTRDGRGASRYEVKVNAGGGDAFLLAG